MKKAARNSDNGCADMGFVSSLFKPEIRSTAEAERATLRAFYAGFLIMGLGFALLLAHFLTPIGIAFLVIGGAILGLNVMFVTLASRRDRTVKVCPQCGRHSMILPGEKYFKCTGCGFHEAIREG